MRFMEWNDEKKIYLNSNQIKLGIKMIYKQKINGMNGLLEIKLITFLSQINPVHSFPKSNINVFFVELMNSLN